MTSDIKNPDCTGKLTGIITASATTGGVPPYTYLLNEAKTQSTGTFTNLPEGSYTLSVSDANGCKTVQKMDLNGAVIPEIILDSAADSIALGDSIWLIATVEPEGMQISWSPDQFSSCPTCEKTRVFPVNNTIFTITATSDDGCSTRTNTTVTVNKRRSFIISNIATANGDGQNDEIAYFAGKDVQSVTSFSLYDRWGNLKISLPSLEKGIQTIPLPDGLQTSLVPGVYTWLCNVTYLDGQQILYKGNFTLLR
jgi:hypothetical protein